MLYDVTLNGVPMTDLAEEIIVRDIVEMPPEEERQTAHRAARDGSRISGVIRRSLSIRIIYNVRAYDVERRADVLDAIARWVGDGGWLNISTRPYKRLYVRPEDLPHLNSSLKWTNDLTLTLTAWEQPFWEDRLPVTLSVSAALDEDGAYTFAGTINPRGTVPLVPLTATITNRSADTPMTRLQITAQDTFILLEGISIPAGGAVTIAYTDDDLLTITGAEGDSLLQYRTAESSDELLVKPRKDNAVTVTADVPADGTVFARGRWR